MTNDERMQRESSLIATIRKELPEFAKACADDTEFTANRCPIFELGTADDSWQADLVAASYQQESAEKIQKSSCRSLQNIWVVASLWLARRLTFL